MNANNANVTKFSVTAITEQSLKVLTTLQEETRLYNCKEKIRVPPADSPNRPALERLWRDAYLTVHKNNQAKTFSFRGIEFGIVWFGDLLAVMCPQSHKILVKAPRTEDATMKLLAKYSPVEQRGYFT